MAWISVHTGVDGPKLRDLRKILNCSKYEATGILVYLWFWGMENAAEDGHILHADKDDIEECIGGNSAGCKIPAGKIVDALLDAGWIDQTDNGFYIHDWEVWQEQWYKAKAQREKDNARKRESRKRKAQMNSEGSESPSENPSDSPADVPADTENAKGDGDSEAEPAKPAAKYTPEFDVFWNAYPRSVGKGEAYKKYQARRREGYSAEELLTAAKNYAIQCKKQGTDKQYIKHPKTFLSDSRPFLDYLPKEEAAATEQDAPPDTTNPFQDWGG